MAWNIVNESYPQVLRGILHQTEEGLPYVAPKLRHMVAAGSGIPSIAETVLSGLALRRFELHNRAGASVNVGIGFRWANRFWRAGQWTDATTTFVDDTTDAQDGPVDSPDFALMTTTASDGWVVYSTRKFSWVSVRIETADVGASADVTARYSNFAGTGWTAVSADSRFEPAGASLIKAAGTNYGDAEERCMIWAPPNDWGKTVGLGTGLPDGVYALNFRTDVATTAAVASVVEVGSMVALDTLADNGTYGPDWSTYSDPFADALVAFFGTANAGNRVLAEVTTF